MEEDSINARARPIHREKALRSPVCLVTELDKMLSIVPRRKKMFKHDLRDDRDTQPGVEQERAKCPRQGCDVRHSVIQNSREMC
jgi:hypothetical protein